MNATEYRIGNITNSGIVTGILQQYALLDTFTGKFIDDKQLFGEADLGYDEFAGIALTEEWLIKIGMKEYAKYPDGKISYKSDKLIIVAGRNTPQVFKVEIEDKHENDEGFCDFQLMEIHYVHQVQNLYFALTREELTIKN